MRDQRAFKRNPYTMTLILFYFGVFFICMAMLWTEGFWGNAITWVNVIISGMVAVTFWQATANALEKQMPSFTYVLDLLAVWGVFALTMGILREITSYLSKYKVRFHKLMESIGNAVMSVLVGLTLVAFTGWTLHMAPLAAMPFRGTDITSSIPARLWSSAMSLSSGGSMTGGNQFPSDGFSGLYRQRRQNLETLEGFRVDN